MTAPLVGVLLVVASSLAFSTLDLARKVLVARISGTTLLFYLSLGQLPFFAGWVLIGGVPEIGPDYYLPASISIVLNIVANLLFMEAVRLSPLSLTVPFLALTPAFTTLLGVPLLGEIPAPVQWVGIVIVVVGAFRLNQGPADARGAGGAWRALASERGSLLMILVALSWSLAMPLDKLALASANVAIHGFVLNAGVSMGMLVVLLLRGRMGELRTISRGWGLMTVGVLVSVVGLAFLLLSLSYLWVAVAETLRRAIGSVSALVLGRWIFDEPVTMSKVVGIALMSAGVALILL